MKTNKSISSKTSDLHNTVKAKYKSRPEKGLTKDNLRLLLDNSPDVIYRFNMQSGHFEYISPSAESVVGYSPKELMSLNSKAVLGVIHPDDRQAMNDAIALLISTGRADAEYRQATNLTIALL